jgi:hypothetical protein
MNSRAHLVEELRPDKTGKMVKRWVKPADDGGVSMTIPAPAMGLQKDSVVDRKALCEELWDALCMTPQGSFDDSLSDEILLLSTDTVQILLAYCGEDDRNCENASSWIGNYSGDEKFLRALATYADAFDSNTDVDFLEMAVHDLKLYDELPSMDDYSAPEHKEFIHELLAITDTLYSDAFDEDPDNTPRVIMDAPLRELLFAHPDKAADIHQVIFDRETTDVDTIKQVIFSPTKSLSEGAL